MGNILKEAIENEMREEIAEDLRRTRETFIHAPAYAASRRAEAHTDRDRVTLAKNHVLAAINELENTSESYDARIPGLISVLGNAEDALADVLKDREIAAGMSLANALYWRVTATDEHGEPITMGAFYAEGDAEEYAKRLDGMGWDAEVEEIA